MLDRNIAENISRVLYPNDNVCHLLGCDRKPEGLGEGEDWEGPSLGALVTPRTYFLLFKFVYFILSLFIF